MNTYAVICPVCHTSFKLSSDLLRVASGWCECGQCQHVFDAQARLQTLAPDHDLMFLPKHASSTNQAVPRLSAMFTIKKREIFAPSPSEVSEHRATISDSHINEQIELTELVISSTEAPVDMTEQPPIMTDEPAKKPLLSRYSVFVWAILLCVLAGIAASSRQISSHWPETRSIFESLSLPTR